MSGQHLGGGGGMKSSASFSPCLEKRLQNEAVKHLRGAVYFSTEDIFPYHMKTYTSKNGKKKKKTNHKQVKEYFVVKLTFKSCEL